MGFTTYAKTSPFLIGGLTDDKGDVHTGDKLKILGVVPTQSFGAPVLQAFVEGKQKPLKLTGKSCQFLAEQLGDDEAAIVGKTVTVEVTNTSKGPTVTIIKVE